MTSYRLMTAADRRFVISAWSSSYRTSPHAGMLSMTTYAEVMHREVANILDHRTTLTFVADEPGETDHEGRPFIYGFLSRRAAQTVGDPYVYYVYVKRPYRRGLHNGLPQAMATELFRAAGIDPRKPFGYACHTSYCSELERKIPLAVWHPLAARYLQ